MQILVPRYRYNPNAKVDSIYQGVALGNQTVTTVRMPSVDGNRMEAQREYGAMIPRGQGGRVATLVLGGMETSLDEMKYILEECKERRFQEKRTPMQIVDMCRLLNERRNDMVKHFQKNPSERPRRRKVGLYLPRGYRLMQTDEPGLKVVIKD